MSPRGHPTFAMLDLLRSRVSAAEVETLLRHLRDGCESCRAHFRRHLYPAAPPAPPAAADCFPGYDHAFASSWRNTALCAGETAMDGLRATSLWAALEGRAHSQRLHMVAREERFQERSLLARLLELGRDGYLCDPRGGRQIAELALAVAERLDPLAHPEGFVADRRAAALANLGNAQRIAGDGAAAGRSFAGAWRSLEEGSGDALEKADLLRLEAKLRLERGDLAGCARRLRTAASIYQRYEEHPDQARALLDLAAAWGHGEPAQGVELARQALELIDARQEPGLALSARHALIWFLNDSGASQQALELLEDSRPLYRQSEGSLPRLRQKWLEGRICRGLGDLAAAEETLKTVWRDFREAGFDQDLTLVSLDLVELFLAQGRTRRAVLLLRRFEPTLRLFKMHSYGMAAWLLVRQALAQEAAQAQPLVREASLYFRRAWRRPVPFRHARRR